MTTQLEQEPGHGLQGAYSCANPRANPSNAYRRRQHDKAHCSLDGFMMLESSAGRVRLATLLTSVLVAGGVLCARPTAQSLPEPVVKANLLFNFAYFAKWPAEVLDAKAPIVFCSIAGPVADALDIRISGKTIKQHPLSVLRITLDGPFRTCAVLYVGKIDSKKVKALLTTLQTGPILSVADSEAFLSAGGMVYLSETTEGRPSFTVNLGAATRAGLSLDSQMLEGAAKVIK
jgi:hypothetical protein